MMAEFFASGNAEAASTHPAAIRDLSARGRDGKADSARASRFPSRSPMGLSAWNEAGKIVP
jgi:hypothetical protein